jgi:protein ImuA
LVPPLNVFSALNGLLQAFVDALHVQSLYRTLTKHMRLISCHNGRLLETACLAAPDIIKSTRSFTTNLPALDQLAPSGSFVCGAVHEILCDPRHGSPKFFAAILARSAMQAGGALVWCDPKEEIYPPALVAAGIPIERLYLLRPKSLADELWSIAECMRCAGVAATIAAIRPGRGREAFSRTQARRMQLAAERGGGVGIFIRATGRTGDGSDIYAAATRWLIEPAAGEHTVQRWKIQLIHGHGGRLNQAIILEHHRDQYEPGRATHLVRATEELADRQVSEKAAEGWRMRIGA